MSEDFNFEEFGKEFDAIKIAMSEMAKGIVPLYQSLRGEGLGPHDAAVLTAELISRWTANAADQQKEPPEGVD